MAGCSHSSLPERPLSATIPSASSALLTSKHGHKTSGLPSLLISAIRSGPSLYKKNLGIRPNDPELQWLVPDRPSRHSTRTSKRSIVREPTSHTTSFTPSPFMSSQRADKFRNECCSGEWNLFFHNNSPVWPLTNPTNRGRLSFVNDPSVIRKSLTSSPSMSSSSIVIRRYSCGRKDHCRSCRPVAPDIVCQVFMFRRSRTPSRSTSSIGKYCPFASVCSRPPLDLIESSCPAPLISLRLLGLIKNKSCWPSPSPSACRGYSSPSPTLVTSPVPVERSTVLCRVDRVENERLVATTSRGCPSEPDPRKNGRSNSNPCNL